MAMTIRIPADLDRELTLLAEARSTSKHALLIEAASRFVGEEATTDRAVEIAKGVATRYADLLRRLEDA